MRHAGTLCQLATLAVFPALCAAAAQTERVEDPIPERIRKGDVVIAAEEFVRAPETSDSSEGRGTNAAYARIQYLIPMGDGSGRLALNDTRGLVYLTDEHGRTPTTFLDIRDQDVGFDDSMFPNESGLVSVAFHPQFGYEGTAGFGKFYTAYSASSDSGIADYLDDAADSHESVIREWTVTDPSADVFSGSSREVFRIGQFAANHNIGTIAFNAHAEAGSPDYGMLYVCLGDGGAAHDPRDHGQSLAVPQGAIIRIDPLADDGTKGYGIPPDNPFVGRDGVAPEIWAYGLRHPQHFSWDTDGRMFIGDIGQGQIEEVNLGVSGANYGWRLREGTFASGYAVGAGPGPRPSQDEARDRLRMKLRLSGGAVRPRRGQRHRWRVRLSRAGDPRAARQIRLCGFHARPVVRHRRGCARRNAAGRNHRAQVGAWGQRAGSGRRSRLSEHLRTRQQG